MKELAELIGAGWDIEITSEWITITTIDARGGGRASTHTYRHDGTAEGIGRAIWRANAGEPGDPDEGES